MYWYRTEKRYSSIIPQKGIRKGGIVRRVKYTGHFGIVPKKGTVPQKGITKGGIVSRVRYTGRTGIVPKKVQYGKKEEGTGEMGQ